MAKTIQILLALSVLIACGGRNGTRYDYAKEPDPRQSEYVIGVADELAIKVWGKPDFSANAVVRPDGTITMPLIGDLSAVGKTPTQLRDQISQQLSNFIRDEAAVVTIALTATNSYSFTVSGNVEHPSVFTSKKYVTIVEAVQMAGGPNRYASPRETKLFRQNKDGTLRVIPIDFNEIQEGREPEANLALVSGDRIFIP